MQPSHVRQFSQNGVGCGYFVAIRGKSGKFVSFLKYSKPGSGWYHVDTAMPCRPCNCHKIAMSQTIDVDMDELVQYQTQTFSCGNVQTQLSLQNREDITGLTCNVTDTLINKKPAVITCRSEWNKVRAILRNIVMGSVVFMMESLELTHRFALDSCDSKVSGCHCAWLSGWLINYSISKETTASKPKTIFTAVSSRHFLVS